MRRVLVLVALGCSSKNAGMTHDAGGTSVQIDARIPVKPQDDMLAVPGGEYFGIELACPNGGNTPRFRPVIFHEARQTVGAFTIDRNNVTCEQYQACVDVGACTASTKSWWCGEGVARVSSDLASRYCRWRGAVLPSVAEWEKSARGNKEWRYPTGDVWDPTRGCERPSASPGWFRRCLHVGPYGMVFALDNASIAEMTRDTECLVQRDGTVTVHRAAVSLMHDYFGLLQLDPTDGEFRCSRPATQPNPPASDTRAHGKNTRLGPPR